MRNFRVALSVIALTITTPLAAHEIAETMQTPVRATLSSLKKPYELELCVADAITQIGGAVPVPVRDGAENVVMLGYGHTPKIVISLLAQSEGTRLEVRTKSGDMDEKLVRELKSICGLS